MLTAGLFAKAMAQKQPESSSTDEWIKKIWCEYTMEFCSAIKKERIPFAATWVDREIIILCQESHTEKDKYHMRLLIAEILKKRHK